MEKPNNKLKKIMVGMSGGVDSSVAAALLIEQGFEVCGVTLKLREDEEDLACNTRTCCSIDDVEDARRVCAKLGIRHVVFSFEKEFKKEVITRFAQGYKNGTTPNPCIDCNRFIKFPMLLHRALSLGFDGVATGHYAKKVFDEHTGRYTLEKAEDSSKEQSYVLYAMTQFELERTLFPLGELEKTEVRKIAIERELVNARKPDSQDICFVPEGNYVEFLNKNGVLASGGDYVDVEGNIIGRHKGHINYTIGQRKGLGVSFASPRYVYSKNSIKNTVTLVPKEDLLVDSLIIGEVNWMGIEKPRACEVLDVLVKTRYHQKERPCKIRLQEDDTVLVTYLKAEQAAAPGQAGVFYLNDRIIGGGTIL